MAMNIAQGTPGLMQVNKTGPIVGGLRKSNELSNERAQQVGQHEQRTAGRGAKPLSCELGCIRSGKQVLTASVWMIER